MNRMLLRAWFAVFVFGAILALTLTRHNATTPVAAATPTPVASASATPTPPAPALTTPGQAITNAASATYSDGTNTYNILSNTVTVTVQNAPSLVVLTNNGTSTGAITTNGLTPAASPVPGDYISDIYTLVNTGNGNGLFTLATAAQTVPTPLPGTNNGVTQSGPETGVTYTLTCVKGGVQFNDTQSTVAAINTDLASCDTTAANGSVNVAVNYQANATGTVNTQLEAQIQYASQGGVNAANSLWVTNQYNDPITADERIDIQKSPNPIASDGTVTWAITLNNGGSSPANYIYGYGTTCGVNTKVCGAALTGPGILVADKVPNGQTTPLPIVSMSPSPGPQALTSGETVTMVYTSDSTALTGWTAYSGGGFPAGTAYVGLFLTGNANKVGLPADPTPAPGPNTSPGSVAAASSQIGWTMKMGPIPGGITVNNVVTAPVGDNKQCIEGPGLNTTATSCDTNGGNPPGGPPGNPAIPLTTPPPVPSSPTPGLSNTGQIISPTLYNGPLGQPDAVGCFNSHATPVPFPSWSPMPNPFPTVSPTTAPTCAATDNNDDYTQAVVTPNPSNTNMPYGAQMPVANTVTVTNSVKNPGAAATAYQLTFPTLPSSLTVTSVTYGAASCSTTSTPAAGIYPLGTISAGATIQYCVTYQNATGASAPYYFQPQYVQLRAAYTSAPSVYYNDTWNILMPGGFVEIVKTANILSGGNCTGSITGGLPSLGVCPGGIIQYAITYFNNLPVTASGAPAEPAAANLSVSGNFVITEDGLKNGSNWATYTGGMFDPAAGNPLAAGQTLASLAANCGLVTLKCGDTNASATFGVSAGGTAPSGNSSGAKSVTDTVPGTALTPQTYGVLMFAAKVH